jgi:pyridoxal phosphate enzyme (YggS family)
MIERLQQNLTSVCQRIDNATAASGRGAGAVRLVGVTKYVDAAMTRMLIEAGCSIAGENRPQVLWDKAAELSDVNVEWHLIGHLQRNKVKRTVELTSLIHSVDSLRLLKSIDEAGQQANRVANVLLEVNVSGEAAKHGFQPDEMPAALESVSDLSHVAVHGLMCMAGLDGAADQARREFASLRALAETLRSQSPDNVSMNELSMGMSGDFELAISEGATLVRVGSALFAGLMS